MTNYEGGGVADSPMQTPCCGRTGWARWLFARLSAAEERESNRIYGARKRRLLGDLQGDILEIGPGAGVNLDYFQPGVHWIGIEPNLHMDRYLRRKAEAASLTVEFRVGVAEALDIPDRSLDAVVGTLVLCSVDEVGQVLREVQRVLKPGGHYVFLEHVAAPSGTVLRRFQDLITPIWRRCADGCHPNRETWASLEAAGFARLEMEHFRTAVPLPFIAPHIAGTASVE